MGEITSLILAAGALGASASGIVEILKKSFNKIGEAGFEELEISLKPFDELLTSAFGAGHNALLRAQYKSDDSTLLPKTLSRGIRAGLREENAVSAASAIGNAVDGEVLKATAKSLVAGNDLSDTERRALGIFEISVEARIEAGMAAATSNYVGTIRCYAMLVAIVLAIAAAIIISYENGRFDALITLKAAIVGVVAVPLAPVYKDVASALTELTKYLRGK